MNHFDYPIGKARYEGRAMRSEALLRRDLLALLKKRRADGGGHYTVHGFRSTFRDWCEENFIHKALAERALAHVPQSKVVRAYQRSDLLEQRRPAIALSGPSLTGTKSYCGVTIFARASLSAATSRRSLLPSVPSSTPSSSSREHSDSLST